MYFSDHQKYRVDGSLRYREVKIGFHERQRQSVFKKREVDAPAQLYYISMQRKRREKPFEKYVRYNGNMDPPDTPDLEVQKIQSGSPVPSHRDDYGDNTNRSRSTMLGVVRGVGEVDASKPQAPPAPVAIEGSPYLILDIRDSDAYDECHIISDERWAPEAATTLVQRGYDNLFMLSGGMRIAYKVCPDGLFTGTPNMNITEATKPPTCIVKASQKDFCTEDINKLTMYIDNALADSSVGSKYIIKIIEQMIFEFCLLSLSSFSCRYM
ncbi:hypothetical protein FSP39_012820 [Pinctada imbricata]|uniref:Rhodanese domain-containing protein n=1 Tax=Pinctada imbricata TaxID=66713 RepID=A0AA88YCS7_PINIB|nr:hypothetical protein FSP39_012820 [Pinctada imbricata]